MICRCGHDESKHSKGECHTGISELTDGSFVWQCSCTEFKPVKDTNERV